MFSNGSRVRVCRSFTGLYLRTCFILLLFVRWHVLEIFCPLVYSTQCSVVLYFKTRENKHSIYTIHLCTSPRGIVFDTSFILKHNLFPFFIPRKSFFCPLCWLICLTPKSSVVYLLNSYYEVLLIFILPCLGLPVNIFGVVIFLTREWIEFQWWAIIFSIILYHPYIHILFVSLLRHVLDAISQKWRGMNVLSFYHKLFKCLAIKSLQYVLYCRQASAL
jgi:hypothetical protein